MAERTAALAQGLAALLQLWFATYAGEARLQAGVTLLPSTRGPTHTGRCPPHYTVDQRSCCSSDARDEFLCDRLIDVFGGAQHEIFHFSCRTDWAEDH